MTEMDRWYVDVNGKIQVIDRSSLQELVRMGFVTGSSEVSLDGVTFRKASEALPPEMFGNSVATAQVPRKPSDRAARTKAAKGSPGEPPVQGKAASEIVQEMQDDAAWLHEKFLPIFSPTATLFVLFIIGWSLWGFFIGMMYVLGFVALMAVWLARGRFKSVRHAPPPTPVAMPIHGMVPVQAPLPVAEPVLNIPQPSSQMPAYMPPGRMRSVSERGDGLGTWILLGIVLLLLLAVAAYFEFR